MDSSWSRVMANSLSRVLPNILQCGVCLPLLRVHLDRGATKPGQAKLSRAKLIQAKLSRAKLIQAKLCQAKLIPAKLSQAKPIPAKLSQAKLIQAKLIQAKLIQVKLSRAWAKHMLHSWAKSI